MLQQTCVKYAFTRSIIKFENVNFICLLTLCNQYYIDFFLTLLLCLYYILKFFKLAQIHKDIF